MAADSPAKHGGNILALARTHDLPLEALHDFSASINPLGMPAGVATAMQAALDEAGHYPEQHGERLVEALAARYGLAPESLLAGHGSTELIYLLPRVLRPRSATIVTPAFGEYARALTQAGIPFTHYPLDPENGFVLDPEALVARLEPSCELVILANPGNPSGGPLDPALLADLAVRLAGRATLLVDEAFVDFCPAASLLDTRHEHDNLYLLRSLTKFYAIPGLRAGYLAGPPDGVAALRNAQEPWSLSAPALHAALACLDDTAYRRATLRTLPRLRRQLAAGLTRLGLEVFDSAANYLLCRLPIDCSAATLATLLQLRGILVRSCEDFTPLDERYLRVAVRDSDENRLLLRSLGALLPESATDA
ncbi:MAG: threonine-phosphate decarboxylase [Desulfuromonas sp.]|nr:MAG: threonine-phosphate decarboxylase [Desulfuromonas sp.]